MGYYESMFNKNIKLNYHIILVYKNDYKNVYYQLYDGHDYYSTKKYDNYVIKDISNIMNELNNNSITYFIIKKFNVFDIGRDYMKNLKT